MTEAEWLACVHPEPMLQFLRGKASDRKVRLFACACCRSVPYVLKDWRSRRAVKVAELFADGLASQEELIEAHQAAMDAHFSAAWRASHADAWDAAHRASLYAAKGVAYPAAKRAVRKQKAVGTGALNVRTIWQEAIEPAMAATRMAQAALLREGIANPFRPVTIDPTWLSANDAAVVKLAQDIYDGRSFGDLPMLAHALEEAGCTNDDILTHCRTESGHVQGCWVVDLLLAKK